MNQRKTFSIVTLISLLLMLAILACSGELTPQSVTIGNLPQYVCPSATPKATDTPLPTSPPTYNPFFTANLSNYQIGFNTSSTNVQWYAQSVGNIYISYSGSTTSYPYFWSGASNVYIGYSPYNEPANSGSYTSVIPADVTYATINVS